MIRQLRCRVHFPGVVKALLPATTISAVEEFAKKKSNISLIHYFPQEVKRRKKILKEKRKEKKKNRENSKRKALSETEDFTF